MSHPKPSESGSPRRRRIEREFGVPVPGEILPEDQWTRTALHPLPLGHWSFAEMFGRAAPVVLDIGCGNGRSVLSSAVQRPEFDHVGTDILPVVIRYATRRANQRGLSNTRFAVIGGRELLASHIAPGTVREIHVYHPQPYYRVEEIGRRLLTPEFLGLAHAALEPGGLFVVQTDHAAYWSYLHETMSALFSLTPQLERWPDAPKGRTRREIIALREGLPVFRGVGVRREGVDVAGIVDGLPAPTFVAEKDKRWEAVERLEREE
jgi:tRNA (guanine-N7-)-methyltransferase